MGRGHLRSLEAARRPGGASGDRRRARPPPHSNRAGCRPRSPRHPSRHHRCRADSRANRSLAVPERSIRAVHLACARDAARGCREAVADSGGLFDHLSHRRNVDRRGGRAERSRRRTGAVAPAIGGGRRLRLRAHVDRLRGASGRDEAAGVCSPDPSHRVGRHRGLAGPVACPVPIRDDGGRSGAAARRSRRPLADRARCRRARVAGDRSHRRSPSDAATAAASCGRRERARGSRLPGGGRA